MFEEIKQKAYEANMLLYRTGLAPFMKGSASECDRMTQVFAIKPENVSFEVLTPEKMCVVTFDGKKVDGEGMPSMDVITHAVLYRRFENIGGISHSYAINTVSFSQAGFPIPAFGTIHASFSAGDIPCIKKLSDDQIKYDYEFNVGRQLCDYFASHSINENTVPAALVKYDGAYSWGRDALTAVENACMLETAADAAIKTIILKNLAEKNEKKKMPEEMLKMQFLRSHEDIIALDEN